MIYAVYKCISLGLRTQTLGLVLLLITRSVFAQETCRSHYEKTLNAHHIVSTTSKGYDAVARAARDALDCYGPTWIHITGWLYTEAIEGLIGSSQYQEAHALANEFFDRYALTADSTSRARLHAQRAVAHYYLGDLENMHLDYQKALRLALSHQYRYPARALTHALDHHHAFQAQEQTALLDQGTPMNPPPYVLIILGLVGVLLVISSFIVLRAGLLTTRPRRPIESGWHSAPPLQGLTGSAQYHTRDLPETINPDNLRTVQIDRSFYIVLPIIRYEPGWNFNTPERFLEPTKTGENGRC